MYCKERATIMHNKWIRFEVTMCTVFGSFIHAQTFSHPVFKVGNEATCLIIIIADKLFYANSENSIETMVLSCNSYIIKL